jgi:hypothetical protein
VRPPRLRQARLTGPLRREPEWFRFGPVQTESGKLGYSGPERSVPAGQKYKIISNYSGERRILRDGDPAELYARQRHLAYGQGMMAWALGPEGDGYALGSPVSRQQQVTERE